MPSIFDMMNGAETEHFKVHRIYEEEVHGAAIRRMKERITSPNAGVEFQYIKDVLLVSTSEDHRDEMYNMEQFVEIEGADKLFAAIICDGFATQRYLFITRMQNPTDDERKEIDAIIDAAISYLYDNANGHNGMEVRNAFKYMLIQYRPSWMNDIFKREDSENYEPWEEFVEIAQAHREGKCNQYEVS